ncbi:MAG: Ldh family oxidoreductase [bacterium]|nr:Ldh family oxidoreductase [bacterium]
MAENQIVVHHDVLKTFLTEMFLKTGMNQENADYCAECMVQTNLWGIDSHGVLRAPIYLQRLRQNVIKGNPDVTTIKGANAFEVMDGDDGIGYVVGRAAMERAIELARQYSVGVVGVVRSNHFGAAALFAKMAAEQGMIGIVMTSVIPNLVVPGGSKPVTGNNPIAIAVPTAEPFPFILDISMSAVAGGKLLLASKKKEKIPLGWATDKDGHPTDDPDKGFAGFLLPLGGHKGFGLSLVVDILSGVITGGAFQYHLKSMYKHQDDPSLTGHCTIVLNPSVIMPPEELKARMSEFYQTLKQSPMWDENKQMFLPGEIEYLKQQEREKTGIPVPAELYEELTALAQELQMSNQLTTL